MTDRCYGSKHHACPPLSAEASRLCESYVNEFISDPLFIPADDGNKPLYSFANHIHNQPMFNTSLNLGIGFHKVSPNASRHRPLPVTTTALTSQGMKEEH